MDLDPTSSADNMLDRLEVKYGPDPGLRKRLRPIIVGILESVPRPSQRAAMLRLVIRAYTHQLQSRETLDRLRALLRQRVDALYGALLGIDPPQID